MTDFAPGAFLDATIARLLWRAIVFVDVTESVAYLIGDGRQRYLVPKFSTEIDDARRLTRMMATLGFRADVRSQGDAFCASFCHDEQIESPPMVEAPTKPLALCRAALEALEGPKESL